MAQETVIHRVDAELADGEPLAAIPADLAADGIDELLIAFVQYGMTNWPEEFAELVTLAGNRTVSVVTPQRSWLFRLITTGVQVEESGADSPNATVKGPGTGRAALAVEPRRGGCHGHGRRGNDRAAAQGTRGKHPVIQPNS